MRLVILSHIQSPDSWPAEGETILENGLIRINGLHRPVPTGNLFLLDSLV